jgi:hypothetical protein
MKPLVLIAIVLAAAPAAAQDFKSAPARQAKFDFERAVAAARENYLKDLTAAAKQALDAGQVGEGAAITEEMEFIKAQQKADEGDPMVLARRKLEGSRWSWVGKTHLTFKKNGVVTNSSGQVGHWAMLEPTTAAVKFQALFVLGFNEDLDQFTAFPYTVTKSDLKGGRKLGGGRD